MSDPSVPPSPRSSSPSSGSPSSGSPHSGARRIGRVLVPVGALVLACSGFAIAYAATDSGSDTRRDVAERGLEPTTTTVDGAVTTTTANPPAPASDPDHTEAFDVVTLPDGATQT